MDYLVQISIGLGLVVSLAFSEFLGLAAGGMVVPGYFALGLGDPARVAMTLVVALLTAGSVLVGLAPDALTENQVVELRLGPGAAGLAVGGAF